MISRTLSTPIGISNKMETSNLLFKLWKVKLKFLKKRNCIFEKMNANF